MGPVSQGPGAAGQLARRGRFPYGPRVRTPAHRIVSSSAGRTVARRSLPPSALAFVLAFAGCVDRNEGTSTGPAGPDAERPIDLFDAGPPEAGPTGGTADAEMTFIDAVAPLDASIAPADVRPAPVDYDPLPDRPPDERDPLCIERPPLQGVDTFDWVGDCGGRNEDTIRGLRNPTCPRYEDPPEAAPGLDVVFDDVVVTGIFDGDFTVQDREGVAFNAIWVHNQAGFDVGELLLGTRLRVEGTMIRFFELDEVIVRGGGIEVIGAGPAPEPTPIIDASRVADDGDLARALESRLVTLTNQRVISTAPDCPSEFGNFVLENTLWVGNESDFDFAPARDDVLRTLTGVLSVSFEHRKILPRSNADFDPIACGGLPDKCEAAECPVPPDAEETGALVVTEIQNNPRGADSDREFVEIYNPTGQTIDLTGWWLQDCGGRRAPLSGEIAARDLLVLAASTNRDANGGVRADLPMGDLFLPNGFGSVLIFDADDRLVDQVRYEPGDPWPDRAPGESLELEDPGSDNRIGENWVKGRDGYGEGGDGTPGELR